jgi:hypothetical protein
MVTSDSYFEMLVKTFVCQISENQMLIQENTWDGWSGRSKPQLKFCSFTEAI